MDRNQLTPYAGREQAWVKHFLLEAYLARVIMITARSKYQRIAYVDAFAGPWKSAQEDLSDTSFAKAIEVMAAVECHWHDSSVDLSRSAHCSLNATQSDMRG